jgi:hypothetical protein
MRDGIGKAEAGAGDRRETRRDGAATKALARQGSFRPLAIELCDISTEGCGFASISMFDPGARVLLSIPGLEVWPATVTWWHDGRGGMSFSRALHPAVAERFAAA